MLIKSNRIKNMIILNKIKDMLVRGIWVSRRK